MIKKLRIIIAATCMALALTAMAQRTEVVDYVTDDGWTYTGQMVDGKRHGKGTVITKKGNIYSGEWVEGRLPEGTLHAVGNEESIYEGQFGKSLSPNGFGIMRYLRGKHAGDVYIGNFAHGSKSGIGRYEHADGTIEFGVWKDGILQKPAGQKFKPGAQVYGIDLSHHNGPVNWANLALYCNAWGDVYKLAPPHKKYMQPVSFAYVRATEGATVRDSLYAKHSQGAAKHRVPKGSYHVICFTTSAVDDQIDNFLTVTNNCADDELPPVLDIEHFNQAKAVGRAKVQAAVVKWLKTVESRTGRRPIIYTNDKFINNFLDMERLKGYTVWLASYGLKNQQAKKEPTHKWQLWQFTENGRARGASPIDINLYRGDYKTFKKKFIKEK